MKKLQILVLSLLLIGGTITNDALAQKGAYANVNLGYNFSLGSENLGYNITYNTTYTGNGTSSLTENRENIKGSLGKGMSFGVSFGYMLSDNIGIELGVSQLIGATFEWTNTETQTNNSGSTSRTSSSKVSASMLQLNPSLVISAGKAEGLNPYGKFGLVIGVGGINWEGEGTDTSPFSSYSTYDSEFELNGGLALGLSSAIGANYYFNEKMSLFGELNMINLSYAPTKGKLTKSTSDGVDVLADATTAEKEYEYVDSYTSSTSDIQDDSKPRQILKTQYSFGSFGIKIGFRLAF